MAIFLRWSDSSKGSQEQLLISMFSTLSPRYYPTNVLGSGLYDILGMYADELVDLYDETQQIFDDLSVETVRSAIIGTRSTPKMYDNFGVLVKSARRFNQDFELFKSGSVVQSYRQQLRFLSFAFLEGTSVAGLETLGRSFTGMAPSIEQHIKANPRWILTTFTGSILTVGEDFVVVNTHIPRIGNVLPVNDVSIFSPGDDFTMSFSHLGSNTKLSGEDLYYNSIVNTYYVDLAGLGTSSAENLTSQIEFQTLRQIRSDQQLRALYSSDFEYYRPYLAYSESVSLEGSGVGVSGSIPDLTSDFAIHPDGFLYNVGRLHATGSVHITPVIDLEPAQPIDEEIETVFQEYRWSYDWMVNTREYGSYAVEVRQYSEEVIPDGIYYIPIVDVEDALPPILPEISGSMRAHWFNVQSGSIFDAHGLNPLEAASVPTYTNILSRDPRRYCFLYDSSITFEATAGGHPELDFSDSMYLEMWLLRLNASGFATAADALVVQRTQGTDYYKVSIDSSGYNLEFEIKDSSGTGYASADISDYLDLGVSDYPHYFAVSYVSGSVFFYADGTQIGTASITTPSSIPSLPLGTQSISTAIAEIGIDEILLSEGYLDENTAEENFLSTRPRITGTGIPSGSVERYHQAKFVFNGYNVRDIELHQFSIRGVHSGSIAKYLNPYYNYPYVLPLFKKL